MKSTSLEMFKTLGCVTYCREFALAGGWTQSLTVPFQPLQVWDSVILSMHRRDVEDPFVNQSRMEILTMLVMKI